MPSNPASATSGGAGDFTRISAYATPTPKPTMKEMTKARIMSMLPWVVPIPTGALKDREAILRR